MNKTIPDNLTYPDVTRGWWAEARYHPDFYCILTRSGFRSGSHIDEKKPEYYFTPDADDKALGDAVLKALAVSRWILPKMSAGAIFHPDVEVDPETSSYIQEEKREREWSNRMRKTYKLKYKKDLYVPMKRCDFEKKDGNITIECYGHVVNLNHGDCWGWDSNEQTPYVILPDSASFEEIGAGLRLAFSRCREIIE